MLNDLHNRIIGQLIERDYNQPLMANVRRGGYVECMIALALGGVWRLPSGVWNDWDVEHTATGTWMEVKQGAAQQAPSPGYDGKTSQPSFSIAPKQGYWNPDWIALDPPRRTADLYVFAWHPVVGVAADHRRADQWEFYVVCESALPPDQKGISLNPIKNLAQAVTYDDLAGAVEEARAGLASLKRDTLPR